MTTRATTAGGQLARLGFADPSRAEALLPPGILPPGQRLLFTGGAGTGKTLAAEVLAHETGSALIVADTPRLVSKWLGETERNLAELFRAAEESRAVLFFNTADTPFNTPSNPLGKKGVQYDGFVKKNPSMMKNMITATLNITIMLALFLLSLMPT